MDDIWFGKEFQTFEATYENDLEVAIVVLRGETHIETMNAENFSSKASLAF